MWYIKQNLNMFRSLHKRLRFNHAWISTVLLIYTYNLYPCIVQINSNVEEQTHAATSKDCLQITVQINLISNTHTHLYNSGLYIQDCTGRYSRVTLREYSYRSLDLHRVVQQPRIHQSAHSCNQRRSVWSQDHRKYCTLHICVLYVIR